MLFISGLFSNLFRGTDITPTDFIAGCILLRVKQKRECREQRRLALIAEQRYKCTSGKHKSSVEYRFMRPKAVEKLYLYAGSRCDFIFIQLCKC